MTERVFKLSYFSLLSGWFYWSFTNVWIFKFYSVYIFKNSIFFLFVFIFLSRLSVCWCGPNKNVQSTLYNESTVRTIIRLLDITLWKYIARIQKRLKTALLRSAGALLKQKAAEIGSCSVHSALQLPYNMYLIYMQIKAIKDETMEII